MPGSNTARGLAARFQVTIDGQNLGAWSTLQRPRGRLPARGVRGARQQPVRALPPESREIHQITLERACTRRSRRRCRRWLGTMVMQPTKGTASITLHDAASG